MDYNLLLNIGGKYAAGIGGGGSGNKSGDGTVTISGGIVTAVGGKYAAGIGGGGGYSNSYNGTITTNLTGGTGSVTISGGIVDAKGGAGNSSGNYAGDPIGNGGNTTATATVEETNAIVFENGAGTVCGDVTLDGSYTVPGDYTLNIPAGASLSGSGTLSGGGTFTTENLTENMISVPTDLYYTGEDRSVDITTRLSDELDKGVTICGQTFTVGGWTLAVEKTDDLTYTATYTNNNDNTNTFTKTITLLKSGTKFEGDVKTYNGDTQTTTFNADDTITVKATPTATGTAPAKAATRLRGGYTAPTAGQMALFVGDVQVSAPVEAGTDGTYTMEVSAAEVLLQGNAEQNGNAITLTAKFVGNDNMADAAGTVDVKISAVAMAEKDGEVIGYFGVSNFEGSNNLFFQNAYTNATITLLEDVQLSTNSETGTTCSTMVNITCALDLAGHNFASTDTAIYVLHGGNLTIQDSSTGKTGNVSFIKSDGTLKLYGGTFGKIETAYTLASLLAENCAYYKGSTPILLSELADQKELTGPVTVQECQHKDVTPTANNDGTHTLTCPYCGYTKTAEGCDYGEYTHNDTSHTRICKLCGYQNVEAHNIKCTAEASGTVIAVSEACETCGYGKDLGTVTIHIPKLVYGDLTGVVTAENTLTEPVSVAGNVKNPLGETIIFSDHATIGPPTMATLTGNALLSAGEHKIKINIVIIRDENALAGCLLPFTVDPATLTADMVTLSAESTTYSGKEQKPTVTVAGLTEGTDYEVSYTRDGVVTNDFTSAGTVKITVTGKGNYGGEVEKTFTIKQAESDVGTVTAETRENTLDVSQVVLSRTNQTLAGTLMLTDSTLKYGTNTYTWKFTPDNTSYKTVTGEVEVTVNDTIAPTGEISIGTNKWNSFWNTITFGLFFKKTEQVTITAQDNESGVASVSYYISDSGLTEDEVKALDSWTAGNTDKTTFNISQKESCVVYAKITDNQGNMTYISSDGLLFDGTLPSITGVTDGKTYCTPQTVTVADDNLETVTVNGKEQILSDGKFNLDVKFDTATIIIAAEDKAGNITTVTVYAGHNYGTDWKSDSNGHWQECVVCGNKSKVHAHTEDSGTATKPATQTETGIRTYKCSMCGYVMRTEEIAKLPPDHTHSYGMEWKSDNSNHWHECNCGAKSDSAAHSEDSGTATKPATETETGIRIYKCSVCGYKMRMEIIEKLSPSHKHSYGMEWKSDHNNHWHECSCGDKSDSAAHTEDSGTVTKTPTKTEKGVRTYKCSVCGYVMRTADIERLPSDTGGSTGGASSSFGGGGTGGSGSMGSGSGGSGGGSTDTGQPFIKDSSGREGWDVIRAEAETAAAAPAGGTVDVDMNGAVSVPGSVFAAIRGKDVTLCFDMGSGITWSVDGKNVTAETAGDTDFSVKVGAGAIPEGLIAEKAGGLAHLELSLAHEGAFGFTATLTVRIVSRGGNGITVGSSGTAAGYTGMYANLFYYDPALRSLEFICAGQVGEDGTADLPFVHASDYTVILSAYPMGGTDTPGEPQEPAETEKPQEPLKQARVKSVKLSKTLYTYNGKPKKPSVTAVDTEGRKISGKYYTVSYKNNKKAGKATAIVEFKGGYSGTVKKTFTIRPAGTSIKKLTAASGGFTVKWKKKTAQTSGYQIQYSTSAGFKGNSTRSVFVKKASVTKQTVKKLKAGKKYYVRIRTYKTANTRGNSTKIYSAWSSTVRVKTLPAAPGKKTASSGRDRAFLRVEKEDGKKKEMTA